MHNPSNTVTVGIFDRKHRTTVTTSNQTFSQHVARFLENVLQGLANGIITRFKLMTDVLQLWASKMLNKTTVIDALKTAL